MILEIDRGNSTLKWRLVDGETVLLQEKVSNTARWNYDEVFCRVSKKPKRILVASVVPTVDVTFDGWCGDRWGLKPEYAQVSPSCMGVINSYQDVSRMGVDRWLAMVAAFAQVKDALIVVDLGSACTVDFVQHDGRHIGGYIVPGIRLMNDALFRDTDRVKIEDIDYDAGTEPGCSTADAVSHGLQAMLSGLVLQSLVSAAEAGINKPTILFVGRGSGVLAQRLQEVSGFDLLSRIKEIRVEPDLVLDGLSLVCTK